MDKTENFKYQGHGSFSERDRIQIVEEYLSGTQTKTDIWKKYTGEGNDHGIIHKWMKTYGYTERKKGKSFKSSPYSTMPTKHAPVPEDANLNALEPEEQIKELKRRLEDALLKAEGYELMVEFAEQELKIPLRKKLAAK